MPPPPPSLSLVVAVAEKELVEVVEVEETRPLKQEVVSLQQQ
jgi:hypothetical protein